MSRLARDMELQLCAEVHAGKIPQFESEVYFAKKMLGGVWRFDFAWPGCMVALEVEGGTYSAGKSRHTTGAGFTGDCHKYATAAVLGWTVLRFDAKHVAKGWALQYLIDVLADSSLPTLRVVPGSKGKNYLPFEGYDFDND